MRSLLLSSALLLACATSWASAQTPEPPKTWIDPDTGHRVHRISTEPGSASLYFHDNGYTPDGKRMIYTHPEGVSIVDLATFTTKPVIQGKVRTVAVGRKTPTLYYVKLEEQALYATHLDTGETRKLASLPRRGSIATINADETLAAGVYIKGEGADYGGRRGEQAHALDQPKNKGQMMAERLAARLPAVLYTIDLRTGEKRELVHTTDWLGHLQFSPTDPTLIMYCHEGAWHQVDRIWTIRTDGTQNTLRHQRTMQMEIAGHEWWSRDGKTIWYDLQTPKGQIFWVAGLNIETQERIWYSLQRNEWSIHFNTSADGTLFCGDGGDRGQVAKAPDGQWIYLFRPELMPNDKTLGENLIRPGVFRSERLVNMAKHDYRLEPNVTFTPDKKYVIFRTNILGPTHVLAVEVVY